MTGPGSRISLPTGQVLEIIQGDLTAQHVDAVVNAANSRLRHGAGVAGVLVRRGGEAIQQESDAWLQEHGPLTHDQPAVTGAGSLPCRYIIHAVGPVWGEGEEDLKLRAAVQGALRWAVQLGLASIALPAISTGIYGFPLERAARVMYAAIRDFCAGSPGSSLRTICIVLYDLHALEAFQSVWAEFWLPGG